MAAVKMSDATMADARKTATKIKTAKMADRTMKAAQATTMFRLRCWFCILEVIVACIVVGIVARIVAIVCIVAVV